MNAPQMNSTGQAILGRNEPYPVVQIDVSDRSIVALVHRRNPQEYISELRRYYGVQELETISGASMERVEVVLGWRIQVEELKALPNLRWLQLTATGADHILHSISELPNPVVVTTMGGFNSELVASFAVSCLLHDHWNFESQGDLRGRRSWSTFATRPLGEVTCGVLGLGRIGRSAARVLRALGVKTVGFTRTATVTEGVDASYATVELADVSPSLDFLIVACSLNASTVRLVGSEFFARCNPDLCIINVARAEIVDFCALKTALETSQIRKAYTDVMANEPLEPSDPAWDIPNLRISPHIAGEPTEYAARVVEVWAKNLYAFATRQELSNVVESQYTSGRSGHDEL